MIFKKLKSKIYKYKDELTLLVIILTTVAIYNYVKYEMNKPISTKQSVIKESFYLENNYAKKYKDKSGSLERLNELANKKIKENEEAERKQRELEQARAKEKERATVSRGESSSKAYYYEVTAYTAGYESTGKRKGNRYYGITASGKKVQEGRTIACPPEIPFGTKIKIESVGVRVCEDRGGAIKSGKLDLYMSDLSEAKKWGRRTLKVTILN